MGKSSYLVGICGIGMSALAQYLASLGFKVRGSDLKVDKEILEILKRWKIEVYEGHQVGRLRDGDLVIYSTAISDQNPELKEARYKGLEILHRSEALNKFLKDKRLIAITGSHGKTTTTYLIASALRRVGIKAGMLLGGIARDLNSNFVEGDEIYVLELDESDGTFTNFSPQLKVITNIDKDHLEFYGGQFPQLLKKFEEFMGKGGPNIICWDDPNLREIVSKIDKEYISFGFDKEATFKAEIVEVNDKGTRYLLYKRGKLLTDVALPFYGYKIALDSIAVFAIADHMGLDLLEVRDSLKDLKGIRRRFEVKLDSSEVKVIEDYAHHPREIQEVIRTARGYFKPYRLIVVFQPHRYTRTKSLWEEFKYCFKGADILFITDIYPAFEEEIEDVSSQRLANELVGVDVTYLKKDELVEQLLKVVHKGDIILVLGAGDINEICDPLVNELKTWAIG
jgi:UDP-N-acetylmuramate--alanine ligase